MDLGIEGRVALVTGGGNGIGREIAFSFAREGVRVAICGRTEEALREVARAIEDETGSAVLPVRADILVEQDLQEFVEQTVHAFGSADIVVNNADFVERDNRFFEVSADDLIEKLRLKLIAPVQLIQLVVPHMKRHGWGRIISIGGNAARAVQETGWGKGAAQAGLINVTKKLSYELGRDGITVNVIEPGGIWTDGKTWGGRSRADVRSEAVGAAAQAAGVSYEEMEARLVGDLVIGRRLLPRDVADLVLFLCSERASAITGETMVLDGGESRVVRF